MAAVENQLIELLPDRDRQRLLEVCEPVELRLADVLYEQGRPTQHVYFPLEGFVSLVATVDHHPGLEMGMVGREGMLGAQLALGVTAAPLRALVHGPGQARRVDAAAFRREFARSDALQHGLSRYIHVLMGQLSTAATCLRFRPIGRRLARWLPMSQDRAHADTFGVTTAANSPSPIAPASKRPPAAATPPTAAPTPS